MTRVLLADHDRVFCHALRRYLQALGYEVVLAEDLDLVARCHCPGSPEPPAVAIIGVDRHGHDGTTVAPVLSRLGPDVPVLLLLNNIAQASLSALVAQENVFAALTKPVLVNRVEATLRAALGDQTGDWRRSDDLSPRHRWAEAAAAAV